MDPRLLMEIKEKQLLAKYGWFVHYVSPTNKIELANIHTHGFKENLNHKDFQIVLPLDHHTAHYLLTELSNRIKNGEEILPNKMYDDIIENFSVYFIEQKEMGRDVLRMILPDEKGYFPKDPGCVQFLYKAQENYQTN